MVQAELKGLLAPDFLGERAPHMDFDVPPAPEYCHDNPPVEINDARQLQSGARSEAAFFEKHAFVLLPHVTAVKDWDRDIGPIYSAEVAALIRNRLLPGRRVIIQQGARVMRRGHRGRFYAQGVHSDGPLNPQVFVANMRMIMSDQAAQNWQQVFARSDVIGFVLINFWRPTHMQGPLRHMPLALCEPNSIERADIVPNTIGGIAPEGRLTEHLALRYNPAQQWFHYPAMTNDEVIAFKLCEFWKDDPDARPQNVFHSAFRDPSAPADVEERKSCEYRAGVMILRD